MMAIHSQSMKLYISYCVIVNILYNKIMLYINIIFYYSSFYDYVFSHMLAIHRRNMKLYAVHCILCNCKYIV
jgi:hypothetical protein